MSAAFTPTSRSILNGGDFFKVSVRYLQRLDCRPIPLSTSATSPVSMLRSHLSLSKYATTIISGGKNPRLSSSRSVLSDILKIFAISGFIVFWVTRPTHAAGWKGDLDCGSPHICHNILTAFSVIVERARRSILEATVPRFAQDDCFSIGIALHSEATKSIFRTSQTRRTSTL
jgi:hypothetical protein